MIGGFLYSPVNVAFNYASLVNAGGLPTEIHSEYMPPIIVGPIIGRYIRRSEFDGYGVDVHSAYLVSQTQKNGCSNTIPMSTTDL